MNLAAENIRVVASAKRAPTSTANGALAPLECTKCDRAVGPLFPVDKDHAGWMCDSCYQKIQGENR